MGKLLGRGRPDEILRIPKAKDYGDSRVKRSLRIRIPLCPAKLNSILESWDSMIYYLSGFWLCQKGVPNELYAGVQENAVETMKKGHLSIYATMQEFGINDQKL